MYPYGTTEGKWPSSRHYHTREPSCSDFVFTSIDDDPTRFVSLQNQDIQVGMELSPRFASTAPGRKLSVSRNRNRPLQG